MAFQVTYLVGTVAHDIFRNTDMVARIEAACIIEEAEELGFGVTYEQPTNGELFRAVVKRPHGPAGLLTIKEVQ